MLSLLLACSLDPERNGFALTVNVCLDALVGQHGSAIDIDLVANAHIISQYCHILQPGPSSNSTVPTDDSALDPCMVLDFTSRQQDAALQSHAIPDYDIGANRDIGPNATIGANLGRRINHDVAAMNIRLRMWHKHLTSLLGQTAQIQASTSQKVLWLADIHPEAVQIKAVELAILANGRERLLFDAGRPQLNAVQDGGVEDVDSGVDSVADELDGLLDKAVNARRVAWVVHHDTVLGRLFDLCYNNCALVAMCFVEIG